MEQKAKINIDDLIKIQIQIGQIKTAENVEGSEKLLKLNVDFGSEQRQIVSGIAKYYKPEDLIDKKVSFVTNLEPRNIMGLESNGMILAAKDSENKLSLLFASSELQNGALVN